MADIFSSVHQTLSGSFWAALLQIVLIDVTLASDNTVAIGMAASGLPGKQRHQAIVLGLGVAMVLLAVLAFFAIKLLKAGGGGLLIAGGLLLFLVGWQMWRDLRAEGRRHHKGATDEKPADHSLMKALGLILVADMSTSLDNVLAVAGVARDQPPWLLFLGLGISIVMTGLAAMGVAKVMQRWPWIGYVGLVVVIYVAGHMAWDGATQLKLIRV
jgi:YjbE family integral membrane protein